MKKILVPLAVVLLLALAVPSAFARPSQLELGMSWTSTSFLQNQASSTDSILGFHAAYDWFILTGSWDSLAINSATMNSLTGWYVPGFINYFDAGLRFKLRPFELAAEIGTNYVYFYNGEGPSNGSWGANLRLSGGLNFGWWGVGVSGTSAFSSFELLTSTIGGLFSSSTRTKALSDLTGGLVPAIYLTFYF